MFQKFPEMSQCSYKISISFWSTIQRFFLHFLIFTEKFDEIVHVESKIKRDVIWNHKLTRKKALKLPQQNYMLCIEEKIS